MSDGRTRVPRRPLIAYGHENLQQQALLRVAEVGDGGYAAENRSESTTLCNLFKRGWLVRERAGGRWVYRPTPEPAPSTEQQELIL